MSFYYSLVMDDRIAMLTDGAVFSPKGLLIDVQSKVVVSQTPPFAITGRGNSAWIDLLCKGIRVGAESCTTFEEVIVLIDSTMKGMQTRMNPWPEQGHFELLIAGWTKDGPLHLYVSSFKPDLTDGDPDKKPFTLYTAPWEIGGGTTVTHEEIIAAGITRDQIAAAGNDVLETFGAVLVDIARGKKGSDPTRSHLPEFYGIGGKLELTTVRPDGVETIVLKEWPDEIGSPIDPKRRAA